MPSLKKAKSQTCSSVLYWNITKVGALFVFSQVNTSQPPVSPNGEGNRSGGCDIGEGPNLSVTSFLVVSPCNRSGSVPWYI